jgi:hypothetical protein
VPILPSLMSKVYTNVQRDEYAIPYTGTTQ